MSRRLIPLALAAAATIAACSKSEAPPASKAAAPATASKAPTAPDPSSGEVATATRERLARQEAAARMFEKGVLEPPPPRTPKPPAASPADPPPVPKAAPNVVAPPSAAAPAKAEAQSPPPTPKQEAPKPSPPPAQPAAAPRTDVAAARPAPAPETAAARIVTRIDPEFPREALQAGVENGRVSARMTLDASGNVTRVEILDANPRRVFDRAVVRALSQWRYNEGAAGRTVEMEIAFALGKR